MDFMQILTHSLENIFLIADFTAWCNISLCIWSYLLKHSRFGDQCLALNDVLPVVCCELKILVLLKATNCFAEASCKTPSVY